MKSDIYLTGYFNRILTNEVVEEDWKHLIDRLVSKNGFTREAAERICAIGEHLHCIRLDEKAEYLEEILSLCLPYYLLDKVMKPIKEYYKIP